MLNSAKFRKITGGCLKIGVWLVVLVGVVLVQSGALGPVAVEASINVSATVNEPTLQKVLPGSGPGSGNTPVTITGTNFTSVIAVTFGGVNALSFTIESPTTISALTPPGQPGAVKVVVVTDDSAVALNNGYSYNNPVSTAVSVSPTSTARPTPGLTVTLTATATENTTTSAVTTSVIAATIATSPVSSPTVSQGTVTATASATVSPEIVTPGISPTAVTTPVTSTSPATPTATIATSPALTITAMATTSPATSPVVTATPAPVTTVTDPTVPATISPTPTFAPTTEPTYTPVVSPTSPTVTTISGTPATKTENPTTMPATAGASPAPSTGPATQNAGLSPTPTPTTIALTVTSTTATPAEKPTSVAGTAATPTLVVAPTPTLGAAPTATPTATTGPITGAPPTITRVSPANGPAIGGTTVIIKGSNFTAETQVTFGGFNPASVVINSPTQLTVVTAPQPPGAVSIVVKTDDGLAPLANGFTFTPATVELSQAPTNFNYSGKLTGKVVTLKSTFSVGVKDASGSGAGWHLVARSTVLSSGKAVIPLANHTIQNVQIVTRSGVPPKNRVIYPLVFPTNDDVIFAAEANSGTGESIITFETQLVIPPDIPAGNYKLTLNVEVLAG